MMQGWQYLFLIEGSLTVEIALWALLWLPRSVQASHLFKEEKKKCATLGRSRNLSLSLGSKGSMS